VKLFSKKKPKEIENVEDEIVVKNKKPTTRR